VKKQISSAYKAKEQFEDFGKADVYILYKVGDKQAPCGQPKGMVFDLYEILLTKTWNFLFDKNEETILTMLIGNLYLVLLYSL
jgi:hypothetical protein